MFFLSDDERFLIKTMRKNELRTLVDMLPMVRAVCVNVCISVGASARMCVRSCVCASKHTT